MTTSLTIQIQQACLDDQESITRVLRMARAAAVKLKQPATTSWIEHELNGYPDIRRLPEYRVAQGSVVFQHPMYGLRPVAIADERLRKAATTVHVADSAPELEAMLARVRSSGDYLSYELNSKVLEILRRSMDAMEQRIIHPVLQMEPARFVGILSTVRTKILDWALDLEQADILGVGLAFTKEEQLRSQSTQTIHIGTMQGVVGSIHQSNVNTGIAHDLVQQFRSAGAEAETVAELEKLLSEYARATDQSQRDNVANRAKKWLEGQVGRVGAALVGLAMRHFGMDS